MMPKGGHHLVKRPNKGAELATDIGGEQTVNADLPEPMKSSEAVVSAPSKRSNGKSASLIGYDAVGLNIADRFGLPESVAANPEGLIGKYLPEKFYGDWWHNAGIMAFETIFAYVVGRYRLGIAWLIVIGAFGATYYRTSIRRTRRNVRDDMTRELAKQKLETDSETTEWLNSFVVKFWAIYEPVLSATIVASVDAALAEVAPGFIDSLRLSTFTLGTKPPIVVDVKTHPKSQPDVVIMDWRFAFTPTDTDDMTARQLQTKVNPKIVLSVRVGKGIIGAAMPILLEDISCSGLMRVKLKLMSTPPHIKMVDLSFLEKPIIDFVLKPIGGDKFGFDISHIPGLSGFIQEQIHGNLGPMMYAPNKFTLDIEQLASGAGVDTAIGVVIINIHYARGVVRGDGRNGNPDPYIKLGFENRGEVARTSVKQNTSHPQYNETKYIVVKSLAAPMTMEVYDSNDMTKDRLIGVATYDLESLIEDSEQVNNVAPIQSGGKVQGEISFDVAYFPVLQTKELDDGTVEEMPDLDTGIVKFVCHEAKDLSISRFSKVTSCPSMLLNGKEIKVGDKVKKDNNPTYELSEEVLVTSRDKCKVGLIIKDDDKIIGSFQMRLDDLKESIDSGNEWFNLAQGTGKVRLSLDWKSVNIPESFSGSSGYIKPFGVVRVHFIKAENLKNVESFTGGKSDPYAKVSVNNFMRARTVHISNELNPQWNEIVYFTVKSMKSVFRLEVMDNQSSGKDRTLGYINIPASRLIKKTENGEYVATIDRLEGTTDLRQEHGGVKGTLTFSMSFYPCLNIEDPTEESENKETETQQSAEIEAAKNSVEATVSDVAKQNTEMEDSGPPKLKLEPEELFKYSSGVLIFDIISASNVRPGQFFEVLVDDYVYPSYQTSKSRSNHHDMNEIGDVFIRELDFSQITLRTKEGSYIKNSDDDITSTITGDTADSLKRAFNNPTKFDLKYADGSICTMEVSLRYIPVDIELDPSESINNMGDLAIDLIDGKNLPAADRSGKSDPFCVFLLNDEKVFKSKVVKKTLNPTFDERFQVQIVSRTNSVFKIEVYDWDIAGKSDLLGTGTVNILDIEPFQAKPVSIQLDGKSGEINMRLVFRPTWLQRKRGKETTMGLSRVGTMPFKGVGLVAGGVGAVAGTGVQGVTSIAGTGVQGVGAIAGTGIKGVGAVAGIAGSGVKGVGSFMRGRKKTETLKTEELTPQSQRNFNADFDATGN